MLQAEDESAGIFVDENQYTRLIANNTVFKNNKGDFGGAIGAYDSDVTVTDCTFDTNEVMLYCTT